MVGKKRRDQFIEDLAIVSQSLETCVTLDCESDEEWVDISGIVGCVLFDLVWASAVLDNYDNTQKKNVA